MPNIKSAKKRVLTTKKSNMRNKALKSNLRTVLKKADVAIAAGDASSAEAARLAIKKIDQAAAKGIMHKNTAARRKAAIARKLNG